MATRSYSDAAPLPAAPEDYIASLASLVLLRAGCDHFHFRYVGKEVAKRVHDEDITYDEYYAYYIDNKGARTKPQSR